MSVSDVPTRRRRKIAPGGLFLLHFRKRLLLSTVNQSEDGNGWILRFWNESGEKTEAVVTFGMEVIQRRIWNLAEDRLLEELPLAMARV